MYTVEDGLLMKMLDYFDFIFPKVHFMGTSNALLALVLLLSINDNWNWHLYHCSLVLILVHIKRTQCFSLEMTINQVSETFLSTFFCSVIASSLPKVDEQVSILTCQDHGFMLRNKHRLDNITEWYPPARSTNSMGVFMYLSPFCPGFAPILRDILIIVFVSTSV